MLDMSWGEVMVIGAVALIVIGPKDLPKALRTVGQMTGKIRRMASEFQGQFNDAIREAELDEVKRQIQGVNDSVGSLNTNFNPLQTVRDELKGAVEGADEPASRTPGVTVSDAPALAHDGAPQTAVEPTVMPVPAVADPAETVARSVQQSAAAEAISPEPQLAAVQQSAAAEAVSPEPQTAAVKQSAAAKAASPEPQPVAVQPSEKAE
jgi:sec-independent protein translocase protein TatB